MIDRDILGDRRDQSAQGIDAIPPRHRGGRRRILPVNQRNTSRGAIDKKMLGGDFWRCDTGVVKSGNGPTDGFDMSLVEIELPPGNRAGAFIEEQKCTSIAGRTVSEPGRNWQPDPVEILEGDGFTFGAGNRPETRKPIAKADPPADGMLAFEEQRSTLRQRDSTDMPRGMSTDNFTGGLPDCRNRIESELA